MAEADPKTKAKKEDKALAQTKSRLDFDNIDVKRMLAEFPA